MFDCPVGFCNSDLFSLHFFDLRIDSVINHILYGYAEAKKAGLPEVIHLVSGRNKSLACPSCVLNSIWSYVTWGSVMYPGISSRLRVKSVSKYLEKQTSLKRCLSYLYGPRRTCFWSLPEGEPVCTWQLPKLTSTTVTTSTTSCIVANSFNSYSNWPDFLDSLKINLGFIAYREQPFPHTMHTTRD